MGLKIKTFKLILDGMVNWIKTSDSKLSNFSIGSVTRTLLESIAIEIESLYFKMHKSFHYAVENSIYHSFDFKRFLALSASGYVTVTFNKPLDVGILISKGYKFFTVPVNDKILYYEVQEDTIADQGASSVNILVKCTEPGLIGNIPANIIRFAQNPMSQFNKIYNESAFVDGEPEESKAERKERFRRYIDTLAKGTADAIKYACISIDRVSGAYVEEGFATITVYAHDSAGNLPDDLKSEVLTRILEYKAAGIEVTVLPVVKKPIDLNIDVMIHSAFDTATYQDIIKNSIVNYLTQYPVSKKLIRAELVRFIMSIDTNVIVNTNLNMDSDIAVTSRELIRAGTVNITCTNV